MFDFGSNHRGGGHGGGHSRGGHAGGHHHKRRHHHQQQQDSGGGGGDSGGGGGGGGGGDFAPPDDGSGDDGSGGDDMGFEGGGCHCGGSCESCQSAPIGFTGHYGPDLYQSGHMHPMGEDNDDFGCDPIGSCSRYQTSPMGWEFDGPSYFGSELGSKPHRFAGDLAQPILSTWGRYPRGSPLTGVFAGDDDGVMNMPMDTITASPSASSGGSFADSLGGVLNVVDQVAQGASTMIAATRAPVSAQAHAYPIPPPPAPAAPPVHPIHRHRPLAPLPYFASPVPLPPIPPPPYRLRTSPGYPRRVGYPYDSAMGYPAYYNPYDLGY